MLGCVFGNDVASVAGTTNRPPSVVAGASNSTRIGAVNLDAAAIDAPQTVVLLVDDVELEQLHRSRSR